MKAVEANLLPFLEGKKQFIIPIYQRPYSWTTKQCAQLWEDVIRAANDDKIPSHFIGSIVFFGKDLYQATVVPQLLVIDGQQRLTTISLLLAAISRAMAKGGTATENERKKVEYYLFNALEEGEKRFKLILRERDRDTLIRVLEGHEPPEDHSPRILDNYRFFEKQITEGAIDPRTVFKGVSKLMMVEVSLDRAHDNPQLIFESLNSTGLDLSQADQIRNYVLMGLEEARQTDLYKRYWHPMEQGFGSADGGGLFDRFMRDYLTLKLKTSEITKIEEVYARFKQYARAVAKDGIEPLLADAYQHSKYFVELASASHSDSEIMAATRDINTLRVDVAYPFLLEVCDDFRQNRLTRDEFLQVLRLVETYVFRRAVCGIPTNSPNKTFATLSKDVDKSNYVSSLAALLLSKDSYRRFPANDEFRRELLVKDVYNIRIRNYILAKLENHDRKEPVQVEGYTIEHVMPQNENLSPAWQKTLGENWKDIHAKYLHTIGNLTLTGYNPELSDRAFEEKRDMKGGFKDSPIRLNKSLANLEAWNEAAILRRAEALADLALAIWPAPEVAKELIEKYRQPGQAEGPEKTYTLEDHPSLSGATMEVFQVLRQQILNLDASVREEITKKYIAYKAATNFVDIIPQRKRLRMFLNMPYGKVSDPRGICKDASSVGHWGNGDVELGLSSKDEVEYALTLIRQALEAVREDASG